MATSSFWFFFRLGPPYIFALFWPFSDHQLAIFIYFFYVRTTSWPFFSHFWPPQVNVCRPFFFFFKIRTSLFFFILLAVLWSFYGHFLTTSWQLLLFLATSIHFLFFVLFFRLGPPYIWSLLWPFSGHHLAIFIYFV